MLLSSAFTALTALLPLASALPQISRKGKYLFDPSGNRFYIKVSERERERASPPRRCSVARPPSRPRETSVLILFHRAWHTNHKVLLLPRVKPTMPSGLHHRVVLLTRDSGGFPEPSSYIDPLSSGSNCTRDIPYLQQLGVNAVRVYSVNSSLNHDDCMSALDTAGIYVLLDVSLPLNGSIDRASPAWTTNLLDQYITTINKFNGYSNVLAYNVGNEVINTVNNTAAARKFRWSAAACAAGGHLFIFGTDAHSQPLSRRLRVTPRHTSLPLAPRRSLDTRPPMASPTSVLSSPTT